MSILDAIIRPKYYKEMIKNEIMADVKEELFESGDTFSGGSGDSFGWVNATSAPQRGTRELLTAFRESPRLRSVVHKIATMYASVPWFIAAPPKGQKMNGKMHMQPIKRHAAIEKAISQGDIRIIPNHPAQKLIMGGNHLQTGNKMRMSTQAIYEEVGDVYWWMFRNGAGVPTTAVMIPPHWVQEIPDGRIDWFRVSWGEIQLQIPQEDMLVFRDTDIVNPYGRGAGFGTSLSDEIDADEYASKFISSTMFNSAIPDALVSVKDSDPDDVDEMQIKWDEKHRGPFRTSRIKFHSGEIDWQSVSHTFKELQMIELREFEAKIITETFGFPPELLGRINESKRSTIDQAVYIAMLTVIMPRLEAARDVYQNQLIPQYPGNAGRVIVDYVSPIPADLERRFKVMEAAPWAFELGEWRVEAGFEHRGPQDEVHMIPIGLLPTSASRFGAGLPPAIQAALIAQAIQQKNPHGIIVDPKKLNTPLPRLIGGEIVKTMTDAEINNVVDQVDAQDLVDETVPLWKQELEEWGQKVLDDLGVSVSFNMLNPAVIQHLEEYEFEHITDLVNETTKDRLREELIEGVAAGEGADKLKERVHDVFLEGDMDIFGVRSLKIARTEINRSANFAIKSAWDQSGVIDAKKWITAFKDSRDKHKALHGTVVNLDDLFISGADSTQYPGNFGVASQDIQCQCTITAVIGEDAQTEEYLEQLWKSFQTEKDPWLIAAFRAFGRGFEKQLDVILEAMPS